MTRDLPVSALDYGLIVSLQLPPPWFVPIEAPACSDVLELANRRLVCDRIAGHDGRHRQVTDNIKGLSVEWRTDLRANR